MNPFSTNSNPPDRKKFIKSMQKISKNLPIQKRSPLYLPPVLIPFCSTARKVRLAKLAAAGRELATIKCHNLTLTRLRTFLLNHQSDLDRITQDNCLDYLWFCEESCAPQSFVKNIKGALSYLTAALRIPSPWSDTAERSYQALIRRAGVEKPPTTKVPILPFTTFQEVIETFILPKLDDPYQIDLVTWRACLCAILQFKLMARQTEVLQFRACDFYDTCHNGVNTMEIRFRKSKTDPQYRGNVSFIPETKDKYCIYKIIKTYFEITGMVTADKNIWDHSFLLSRTAVDGSGFHRNSIQTLIHDGRMKISSDTVMKDFNKLLRNIGFTTRVTTKCFKILGVSTAFRCGLSTEEVRILGRWKSLESVQHYRHTLPWTLIEMSSNLTLKTMSLAVSNPSLSLSTQTDPTDIESTSALSIAFKYAQVDEEKTFTSTSSTHNFSVPVSTVPTAIINSNSSHNFRRISSSIFSSGITSTTPRVMNDKPNHARVQVKPNFDPPIIRIPFKSKKKSTPSGLHKSHLSDSVQPLVPEISSFKSSSHLLQLDTDKPPIIISEVKTTKKVQFNLQDHDYL